MVELMARGPLRGTLIFAPKDDDHYVRGVDVVKMLEKRIDTLIEKLLASGAMTEADADRVTDALAWANRSRGADHSVYATECEQNDISPKGKTPRRHVQ